MKHRRIKLVISFCYWTFLILRKAFLKLLGREIAGRCTAVYFHSVKDGEKENFLRQINLLKKLTVPLRADFAGRLPKGKNSVILTFDDGFKSLIKNVLPELVRLGIPCTIFFPVQYLGCRPAWEFNKRFHDEGEDIMTPDEIKSLPPDLVLVGSHSFSHSIMTDLNPPELKKEFTKSKETLESITGRAVDLFSFPYGAFNTILIEYAIEAGYKRTFTGTYEVYDSELSGAVIGRVRTDPLDTMWEFRLKVLGAYEWMYYFRRIKENIFTMKGKDLEIKKSHTGYRASEAGS